MRRLRPTQAATVAPLIERRDALAKELADREFYAGDADPSRTEHLKRELAALDDLIKKISSRIKSQ